MKTVRPNLIYGRPHNSALDFFVYLYERVAVSKHLILTHVQPDREKPRNCLIGKFRAESYRHGVTLYGIEIHSWTLTKGGGRYGWICLMLEDVRVSLLCTTQALETIVLEMSSVEVGTFKTSAADQTTSNDPKNRKSLLRQVPS